MLSRLSESSRISLAEHPPPPRTTHSPIERGGQAPSLTPSVLVSLLRMSWCTEDGR